MRFFDNLIGRETAVVQDAYNEVTDGYLVRKLPTSGQRERLRLPPSLPMQLIRTEPDLPSPERAPESSHESEI